MLSGHARQDTPLLLDSLGLASCMLPCTAMVAGFIGMLPLMLALSMWTSAQVNRACGLSPLITGLWWQIWLSRRLLTAAPWLW